MSRVTFPPKTADETVLAVFDFLSLLGIGETLSSASVTASVYSGTDASPSSIISGSDTISGSQVRQLITAGEEGVTYLLTATALTSASQTLQLSGYLVIAPADE